jgi:hypothetical protein
VPASHADQVPGAKKKQAEDSKGIGHSAGLF